MAAATLSDAPSFVTAQQSEMLTSERHEAATMHDAESLDDAEEEEMRLQLEQQDLRRERAWLRERYTVSALCEVQKRLRTACIHSTSAADRVLRARIERKAQRVAADRHAEFLARFGMSAEEGTRLGIMPETDPAELQALQAELEQSSSVRTAAESSQERLISFGDPAECSLHGFVKIDGWKIISAEVNVDFNDKSKIVLSSGGGGGSTLHGPPSMNMNPMYRQDSASMGRLGFASSPAEVVTSSSKTTHPRCTVRVCPECPWIVDQLHVAERSITECLQVLDSWNPADDESASSLTRILAVAVQKISTAIASIRLIDSQLFCERRELPLLTSSSQPEVFKPCLPAGVLVEFGVQGEQFVVSACLLSPIRGSHTSSSSSSATAKAAGSLVGTRLKHEGRLYEVVAEHRVFADAPHLNELAALLCDVQDVLAALEAKVSAVL